MRQLHEWYIEATAKGQDTLMVNAKKEHYFNALSLAIEFDEIFQLYQQDALDKTLVSAYCL